MGVVNGTCGNKGLAAAMAAAVMTVVVAIPTYDEEVMCGWLLANAEKGIV